MIGGEWRRGGGAETIVAVDPATEDVLCEFPAASAADTEEAIGEASAAQAKWRATLGWARADLLHKCADVMLARTEVS